MQIHMFAFQLLFLLKSQYNHENLTILGYSSALSVPIPSLCAFPPRKKDRPAGRPKKSYGLPIFYPALSLLYASRTLLVFTVTQIMVVSILLCPINTISCSTGIPRQIMSQANVRRNRCGCTFSTAAFRPNSLSKYCTPAIVMRLNGALAATNSGRRYNSSSLIRSRRILSRKQRLR